VFDKPIYIAMGESTSNTGTVENARGYIDAIYVSTVGGSSTGTVALAIVPKDGNTSAISIATGDVTGSKVWRPRLDATAVDGTGLTTDPPVMIPVSGDTLRLIMSASTTGITWRADIIMKD
jgi:hypothetical protein